MITQIPKLKDKFSLSNGVFTRLKSYAGIPWGSDASLAHRLDLLYLGNHSGNKFIAPVLDQEFETTEELHQFEDDLVNACYSMYKNKWTRLWALAQSEYNPLENYRMVEEHTGNDTGLDTPTNWKETETQTPTNWKETTDHKVSNDYKETESQKPTNWTETTEHSVSQDFKETESQKPTNWTETTEHSVSNDYKESDTEKPTNWKKTTESAMDGSTYPNESNSVTKVVPFNGSGAETVTENENTSRNKVEETQGGTYAHEHTQTGTKTEEKTQTGTFDTERTQTGTRTEEKTQSGTFDTERTQTGTKTEEKTQSGTFDTERTQTGTRTEEKTQSGTFDTERTQTGYRSDERTQSGTFKTETEHTGTFEKKMTYNSKLERSGNIGVTTSQQMAQSEIELWQWNYFEGVFNDLDSILCLSTY